MTGERETGEYQCEASTDTGNVHAAFYGNLEFKRSENALPYRKCRQIKETLFFKGRLTNEISQSCLSILSSLDFFFRIQIWHIRVKYSLRSDRLLDYWFELFTSYRTFFTQKRWIVQYTNDHAVMEYGNLNSYFWYYIWSPFIFIYQSLQGHGPNDLPDHVCGVCSIGQVVLRVTSRIIDKSFWGNYFLCVDSICIIFQ